MATDGRYLTIATLKRYVRSELQLEDDLLSDAILSAEQSIDNKLGRRMVVAAADSARSYRPHPATRVVHIDDATGVTSVVENGSTLTVTDDYLLEPLNGLTVAGETVPYHQIRRIDRDWYTRDGDATVTVTATWGWAAIPALVKEACKIIAKDILDNRNVRFGLVDISEAGGVGSRDNQIVREMIAQYTSPRKTASMVA